MGLVLTVAALRSGSVLVPIVAHAVHNAGLLLVARSAARAGRAPMALALPDAPWIALGLVGVAAALWLLRPRYHSPVFGIEAQGSRGGSASPF